ncbi:hypothetical protein B1812_03880 [Methylocystis bryophila]|uniref:DUF3108 domain-containing protein n=1 Tax=Methylocystis bryophila TaxID=655015 RepID=A0A1W6N0K0_9HYPH|nr:hypothetical protein B1812_03880 [Methylocystis bryophila]
MPLARHACLRAWRRLRLLPPLILAMALMTQASKAENFRAIYGLSLMGMPIGTASANGVLDSRAYKLEIGMRTSGLATLVNSTRGAATATGKFAPDGPSPTTFAHTIANSASEMRTVRMALADKSVRQVEVNPPPWDAAVRLPVTDEQKRRVFDPVSALIMAVPAGEQLIGPSACNRTIPVFDGIARFDVRLSYVETRSVRMRGYAGPVSVCSARYYPISGHRPDSQSTKFMADNREISVWLAPLATARVVFPLRIDLRTAVGMMSIEASEFEFR